MRRPTSRPPRAAFTLVELLVVLFIIAILTALTAAAVQRVRVQRAVKTAEDVVSKVQAGLDNQVKVIADNVKRERLTQTRSTDFSTLLTYCGNDEDRAEALLLYCRLRQYLPETAAEASAASFAVGGVTFPRPPAFANLSGMTGNVDEVSAALLYAALSRRTIGGNTFASDDATTGAQGEVNVGLAARARVYRDGWENPIAFRRFHRSAELDNPPYSIPGPPGGAEKTDRDPLDRLGRLPAWTGWPNRTADEGALGTTFPGFSPAGTAPRLRNTVPTAYSFGLNKVPNGLTDDDILGYKLRELGARGFRP